jgi:hypothetical protein
MEISLTPYILPIAVAFCGIALTSYINIKIKFAKDESDAFRTIRATFLNIARVVMHLWVAYFLYKEIVSIEPPTRLSILLIVLYSFSLFWWFISGIFFSIIDVIRALQATQSAHLDLFEAYIKKQDEKALTHHSSGTPNGAP